MLTYFKSISKYVLTIVLSVILYGALRSYSVDLDIDNFTNNCSIKQLIVDTIITRNCSIFLSKE